MMCPARGGSAVNINLFIMVIIDRILARREKGMRLLTLSSSRPAKTALAMAWRPKTPRQTPTE
jgi:hypothetical protein